MKKTNLMGRKFDRLLVQAEAPNGIDGSAYWECLCDCGEVVQIKSTSLLRGLTKSCGCLRRDVIIALGRVKRIDLMGQRFERLLVVGYRERTPGTRFAWECKCDCGKTVWVPTSNLTRGSSKSCGCRLQTK